MLLCQLPEAFRRLSRLSSPSTAKASTVCAYYLGYITLNSLTRAAVLFSETTALAHLV